MRLASRLPATTKCSPAAHSVKLPSSAGGVGVGVTIPVMNAYVYGPGVGPTSPPPWQLLHGLAAVPVGGLRKMPMLMSLANDTAVVAVTPAEGADWLPAW